MKIIKGSEKSIIEKEEIATGVVIEIDNRNVTVKVDNFYHTHSAVRPDRIIKIGDKVTHHYIYYKNGTAIQYLNFSMLPELE